MATDNIYSSPQPESSPKLPTSSLVVENTFSLTHTDSLANPFHLAHAITNIKTLIPVTLDIKNSNYRKWSHVFLITAGRFLLDNLLLGKPKPDIISAEEWQRADFLL
ncbi:hypothetical protein POM88_043824 [Heracleum sosnowskyi]|uniref:Uncharacterized protein n=1 Tax=Heracleum sosnowskyi TaxID=360622 RepID=A0AAD8H475_9APIA|nr:hypothetical protein POM88_043824 [Heracleum sosnowskyi]